MKYTFDELTYLYLADELSDDEKIEFENLIAEDPEKHSEFEAMKKFNQAISDSNRLEVSDKLLTDSRRDLRINISQLAEKKSNKIGFVESIKNVFIGKYSIAFGSAFSLLIGLTIGYLIFSSNPNDVNNLKGFNLDEALSQNYKINNIQFLDEENSNENLTVQFEAVKPVQVKGNISDPSIKSLLAAAIINSDNPGLKMRSINKLSEDKSSSSIIDQKVKDALITAVKSDPNPGVRKEALSTLTSFKIDNEIRDAILFVLKNDTNSALRIDAVNALSKMKLDGIPLDEKTFTDLSNQIENEKSEYIKLRTTALLGEIK